MAPAVAAIKLQLLADVLLLLVHRARGFNLGCDGDDGCSAGLGYRDGRCEECDCCPSCWTCVELHHYECAERNGLAVQLHAVVDLGTVAVGQEVSWAVATAAPNASSSGWLQCAAFPSLPAGLVFDDDGTLVGVVQHDPNKAGSSYPVSFFAISTAGWAGGGGGIQRLELRFTVAGNAPGADRQAVVDTGQKAEQVAHAALHAAFGAYKKWEQQTLSHGAAVDTMVVELAKLKAVLDEHPRLGGGRFYMWLGGLHMNIHSACTQLAYIHLRVLLVL